jgi:hypothetical protein
VEGDFHSPSLASGSGLHHLRNVCVCVCVCEREKINSSNSSPEFPSQVPQLLLPCPGLPFSGRLQKSLSPGIHMGSRYQRRSTLVLSFSLASPAYQLHLEMEKKREALPFLLLVEFVCQFCLKLLLEH